MIRRIFSYHRGGSRYRRSSCLFIMITQSIGTYMTCISTWSSLMKRKWKWYEMKWHFIIMYMMNVAYHDLPGFSVVEFGPYYYRSATGWNSYCTTSLVSHFCAVYVIAHLNPLPIGLIVHVNSCMTTSCLFIIRFVLWSSNHDFGTISFSISKRQKDSANEWRDLRK